MALFISVPEYPTQDAVRKRFRIITGRFAGFQTQFLNVHLDFRQRK
jgi:hypothetical protein